jgi:hypothetical protein
MDEDLLVRKDGLDETPDAFVRWIEYRINEAALESRGFRILGAEPGQIVHRSAHIEVKQGLVSKALAPDL